MTLIRILDLETTGTEPTDEVVEIAAIDYDLSNRSITIVGTDFVRPSKPIPPQASAIHHIIDSDVADAKLWDDVWPLYLAGEVSFFAAHHAAFEGQWLSESMRHGRQLICTYKAALRVWPEAPSHSNQTLRYWRGFDLDREMCDLAHRALPDAYVTANLLRDLLDHATLPELIGWTKEPALLPNCPIGDEWRGKKWSDVDEGFLKWMIKKPVDDPDLVWNAKHELSRRWDEQAEQRRAYLTLAKMAIAEARSVDDLKKWFADERDAKFAAYGITTDCAEYHAIVAECTARKAQLLQPARNQQHASAA